MQHLIGFYPDRPQLLLTTGDGELTALHLACSVSRPRTLEVVLPMASAAQILDVAAGYDRETPLLLAVISRNMDVVRRLLDLGAPINSSSLGREGLLHRTLRYDRLTLEMLELLLDRGADPLAESVRWRNAQYAFRQTIMSDAPLSSLIAGNGPHSSGEFLDSAAAGPGRGEH
jgi:hypothetical protein